MCFHPCLNSPQKSEHLEKTQNAWKRILAPAVKVGLKSGLKVGNWHGTDHRGGCCVGPDTKGGGWGTPPSVDPKMMWAVCR